MAEQHRRITIGVVLLGGVIVLEISHFILHETPPPHIPERSNQVVLHRDFGVMGVSSTAGTTATEQYTLNSGGERFGTVIDFD